MYQTKQTSYNTKEKPIYSCRDEYNTPFLSSHKSLITVVPKAGLCRTRWYGMEYGEYCLWQISFAVASRASSVWTNTSSDVATRPAQRTVSVKESSATMELPHTDV